MGPYDILSTALYVVLKAIISFAYEFYNLHFWANHFLKIEKVKRYNICKCCMGELILFSDKQEPGYL